MNSKESGYMSCPSESDVRIVLESLYIVNEALEHLDSQAGKHKEIQLKMEFDNDICT
jgi:hypothetical protein